MNTSQNRRLLNTTEKIIRFLLKKKKIKQIDTAGTELKRFNIEYIWIWKK